MAFSVNTLVSLARDVLRVVARPSRTTDRRTGGGGTREAGRATDPSSTRTKRPAAHPDASARRLKAVVSYSPSADGDPDPGEIVWSWVAYEDDPTQGKDRPVLLIGRSGTDLLGLMLTSRDRNNERDHDDRYVDVGTGGWDRQGRPSEVKVDRVLRLSAADIRREGSVLPRERFERVIAAVPAHLLQ
jgi:hypothetical protein